MLLAAGLSLSAFSSPFVLLKSPRMVVMGGTIAEILVALGKTDQIVATGITSTYPERALRDIPRAGFMRRLSAEAILAHNPDMLLTMEGAGPPVVLDQLTEAGIAVHTFKFDGKVETTRHSIRQLGELVDQPEKAESLITTLEKDMARLQQLCSPLTNRPKVLFIYARGQGVILGAGEDTGASHMIAYAHGQNAVSGFTGFKPLSAEVVVASNPDVILMLDKGLASIGGIEGVLGLPGISATPAGQNKRIVSLDDMYLNGYGPRMGKAAIDLAKLIHPELAN